jgi:hypothetical protein
MKSHIQKQESDLEKLINCIYVFGLKLKAKVKRNFPNVKFLYEIVSLIEGWKILPDENQTPKLFLFSLG